jgi:hypothetical protein
MVHTIGCRRYICKSCGVRARAVRAASGRAHGECVRRARGEAGDVERCRVSARVHGEGTRGRARRIDQHCVVRDDTVRAHWCGPH